MDSIEFIDAIDNTQFTEAIVKIAFKDRNEQTAKMQYFDL